MDKKETLQLCMYTNSSFLFDMNITNDFICGSIGIAIKDGHHVNNFDQEFDFNCLYICNYLFNDIYSIRSGTYSECRFEFRYCKPNNDYLTKFDNLFYGTHWTTDVSTVDSEFELAYKNGVFAMHSFDYNDVNDGAFQLYSGNIDT